MGTVLSVTMLVALALLGGAAVLWRRPGARRQAILMVVLASVMIANVLIWAVPATSGDTLAGAARGPEN